MVFVESWYFNCTFEDGMCGWRQSSDDDADWTLDSGGTPSSETGPTVDKTTASGCFCFTNKYFLLPFLANCHLLHVMLYFHHQPEWNPYNLLLSLSPMFLYVCLDLDFVFSNFSVARARCIILENWEDDQNRKTRPFYLHLDCLFSYLNPERAGTESPFRILLFWQLCSAVIMSPCM